MPRRARKYIGASFFHIMLQGLNKEYIYSTMEDKEKYYKLFTKYKGSVDIISYCIMDNHVHFLIYSDDITAVSKWMHYTNTEYAKYYNKKYERVGYLFRDRYKTQEIENIGHLYKCVDYIHNNPVKAGLCQNKEQYKYSSMKDYYNGDEKKAYDKIDIILGKIKYNDTLTDNEKDICVFYDIDIDKETICQELINTNIEIINKNNEELKKLIRLLKNYYNISYRTIEKYSGINREKLRRINSNK